MPAKGPLKDRYVVTRYARRIARYVRKIVVNVGTVTLIRFAGMAFATNPVTRIVNHVLRIVEVADLSVGTESVKTERIADPVIRIATVSRFAGTKRVSSRRRAENVQTTVGNAQACVEMGNVPVMKPTRPAPMTAPNRTSYLDQ